MLRYPKRLKMADCMPSVRDVREVSLMIKKCEVCGREFKARAACSVTQSG